MKSDYTCSRLETLFDSSRLDKTLLISPFILSKNITIMTIDVRKFVYENITPYEGDASFLAGPTEKTKELWNEVLKCLKEERDGNGLRSADPETISTITSHKPGYIKQELETIVGLQTDAPLRRAIKPFGGVRVVEGALQER